MSLHGTIYAPAAPLTLSGGAKVPSVGSLAIADTITITGNATAVVGQLLPSPIAKRVRRIRVLLRTFAFAQEPAEPWDRHGHGDGDLHRPLDREKGHETVQFSRTRTELLRATRCGFRPAKAAGRCAARYSAPAREIA
jgi:hypothetical protein